MLRRPSLLPKSLTTDPAGLGARARRGLAAARPQSRRGRGRSLAAAALLLAGGLSCSKGGLTPIDNVQVKVVDNLLDLHGRACTDPPEQTNFPVKILFVIDNSGSMQFVDDKNRRAQAVEEVILQLRSNPSVSFAIISFNGKNQVLTKPSAAITAANPMGVDLSGAFTRDPGTLQTAVGALTEAELVTDYQGALSTAFRVLSQDMLAAPPAELARTKYVVLFLSDGDPFPTCCTDESEQAKLCEKPKPELAICTDPERIRAQIDKDGQQMLPYLPGKKDYNQPYQINAGVRDIMDLTQSFTVGELRMHTAFIFDESKTADLRPDGCYRIGPVNFVCPEKARKLLGEMAKVGGGVFRDFSTAEELDFLSFDLTSIKREKAMKNLLVVNESLRQTEFGQRVDTDGDGVPDKVEHEAEMNPLSRDSDSDGFSDSVEWRLRRVGLNPISPDLGCDQPEDRADIDGDGLSRCEELLLRTSTKLFDTDRDGVPDGIEVRVGTDPAKADALEDADLDGVRNGDEIRVHTNVSFDEGTQRPFLAYRYRTTEAEPAQDGGRCYDFRVKNVQLGTPLARPGEEHSYGRNEILLYLGEAPFNDPKAFGSYKVACVRARYVPPDFKDPLGGEVELKPEDFHHPDELDRSQHCVGLQGAQ